MVLLSAHGGGTGGVERSSRAGLMAGDRLDEITAQARALVAAGRGRELMLMPGWWYVISAESFLDRLTEMPDVLELAPQISCPTLFVRGDQEDAENYPAERFRDRAGRDVRCRDRARLRAFLCRARGRDLRSRCRLARAHARAERGVAAGASIAASPGCATEAGA